MQLPSEGDNLVDIAAKLFFALAFARLAVHVAGVARGLRAREDGRVNQMENELPSLRVLRPVLGVLFYLALLEWLVPGVRLEALNVQVPPPVRMAGALLCGLGVEWAGAGFRALGPSYRGGLGLWDDHELVTTGPYAVVRHPIYVGFIGMMVGLLALSGNPLLGVSGLLLTVSIPLLRVRTEERQLAERFGVQYRSYAARVGGFVPHLRRPAG